MIREFIGLPSPTARRAGPAGTRARGYITAESGASRRWL
ncbi:hypothetical protein I553_1096 [Mycobacterium xenopi 4042]|uniref:Uncharacterized protein n=1 Tax=Mycobacterium xenopi 4042 TaxID=1299334 RepID=X7ZAT4_MYCXE|nr:hypothetical protein I553_1096 [Mycobacterium xenopi 4042]